MEMVSNVEISSALMERAMREVWNTTRTPLGDYARWERCGILRGRDGRITRLDMTDNVAVDPERGFEIDPRALIDAYKLARRRGALEIMGFFHTHPRGTSVPSRRDADEAAPDGKIWMIASQGHVRLWRAVENGHCHGRFDPVLFDLLIGRRVEKNLGLVQHVDVGQVDHLPPEPELSCWP